jgi:hypothetical protein
MGYGFGFYRHGMWFGFGQVRFRRWAVDICLLRMAHDVYPGGYNRHWFTVSR